MMIAHPLKAALGLSLCTWLAAMAHAEADLSVSPLEQSVAPGSIFSVDVNIAGVTDLYGYQFDVRFNPALIEALSSTEGSFLQKGGSTFFIPGTNGSGTVSATADTLISNVPGVSGKGNLAVLTFEAIKTGFSAIVISGVDLINSGFNSIASSSTGGSVTVSSSSHMSAPEIDPASAASALTLLFGSLAVIRRRKAACLDRHER